MNITTKFHKKVFYLPISLLLYKDTWKKRNTSDISVNLRPVEMTFYCLLPPIWNR